GMLLVGGDALDLRAGGVAFLDETDVAPRVGLAEFPVDAGSVAGVPPVGEDQPGGPHDPDREQHNGGEGGHRVSHQSTATIAATAAAVPEARPMRAYHQRLTGAPPGSGRRSTPWPGRRSGRWSRRVRA